MHKDYEIHKVILGIGLTIAFMILIVPGLFILLVRFTGHHYGSRSFREQAPTAIVTGTMGLLALEIAKLWLDFIPQSASIVVFHLGKLNITYCTILSWIGLNACCFALAYLTAPIWESSVGTVARIDDQSTNFRM